MKNLQTQLEKLFSVTQKVSLEMENISLRITILDMKINNIESQNNERKKTSQEAGYKMATKVHISLFLLLFNFLGVVVTIFSTSG